MLLDSITGPADLRTLTQEQLDQLAEELRQLIVDSVERTGHGHLGSNLGAVELTLALHRVFDSPRDILLWDTGHQAYVHKMLTGRAGDFDHAAPGRRAVGLPVAGPSPSTTGSRTATPPRSSATPTASRWRRSTSSARAAGSSR